MIIQEKMNEYFENLNETLKDYFHILSKNIPDFLYDYIQTKEMQKQAGISVSCSAYYSKLFGKQLWYSSLDHSVAVALIVWNFTQDKKQTLAGLFHDIATPAFKHCVDFFYGDYDKQESTEELTEKIIRNSTEIMKLLKKDQIKVEEIYNYHIYPIADNDIPKLSADRLEYTLSNSLGARANLCTLDDVREIYNNIEIQKNEDGVNELGFKNQNIAEKFVKNMSKLSLCYRKSDIKFSMQFIADIIKIMATKQLLTIEELYNSSEKEIINKIEKCEENSISQNFKKWKEAKKINESNEVPRNVYYVDIDNVKKRYINPLVKTENNYKRIYDVSIQAKKDIDRALEFEFPKYAYLDFLF